MATCADYSSPKREQWESWAGCAESHSAGLSVGRSTAARIICTGQINNHKGHEGTQGTHSTPVNATVISHRNVCGALRSICARAGTSRLPYFSKPHSAVASALL